MSAGDETYVLNAFKAAQVVEEMWTFDGLTSRQIEELYRRNPLAPGGYETIFIHNSTLPPNVTITSVTEPAVESSDVTVVASSPSGTLSYNFEIEFSTNNWLTIQNGPSNVWTVPPNTEGFFWRVTVTADDGTTTDSETWVSPSRIDGATSETILDTYTATGSTWRAGNGWYNSFQGGSWTSTGTSQGLYCNMDGGAYIRYFAIRTGVGGPNNLPAGTVARVTYDNGTVLIDANWNSAGYGSDLRFDISPQYNQADFGPGGSVGTDAGGFKIELIVP